MARSPAYATAFFFASLFMLGGTIFFAYEVWESQSSAAWPSTSGVIVSSFTEKTCGGARTTHSREAKIRYEYRVDGRAYTGNRVSNMRIYCDRNRGDADAWLQNHFPRGKQVDVYYNPSDPDAAFLHPGVVSKIDVAMR